MFGFQQQQQQQQQHQQQGQPPNVQQGGPHPQQAEPISLPIGAPRSKEDVHRYYGRLQFLKAQLGDGAGQNQEFLAIQHVLKEFARQRAMQMQHAQQQGQPQTQTQQRPQQQHQQHQQQHVQHPQGQGPVPNAAQQFGMNQNGMGQPSPQQIPQQQQQQQQQQPTPQTQSTPQMRPQMSPAPNSPQVGNGGSRSPSSAATGSAFTQEQAMTLRCQMSAFKALSTKKPIPTQILQQIFPNDNRMWSGAQQPSPQPQQSPAVQAQQSPASNTPMHHSRTPSVSSPHVPQAPQGQIPPQAQASTPQPVQQSPAPKTPQPPAAPVLPAEPETNVQKLGVQESIDPWSYLADQVPFDKLTARQKQLFVPSIMPSGFDLDAMMRERELEQNSVIVGRIEELDNAEEIDQQVERKALQLSNYRKAVKGDLLANIYYFNTIGIDQMNRAQHVRHRRPHIQDALATEAFEREQENQRMAQENRKKDEQLMRIKSHCAAIANAGKIRRHRYNKLGKSVSQYHQFTEKEEQKRAERTAKQRLQALRANDEEAYIKLLDQTKDTRITHLLRQTNQFLQSLAEAVKTQQREDNEAVEDDLENLDDDSKVDYYAVAHRVKEEVTEQPKIMVGGTLKEYQMKGLQWMVSLYNNNLNGILADEMGLGKTIQTIALITYLIEKKNIPGPYLVIVPLSTLTNWTLEFEKWAPGVKKVVYKGPPPARKAQQAAIRSGDFQVLLTTYEYIIKDRPVLSRIRWVHMVIDEGHRMKNANSKLSYTLTQYYSSKYRLILTGTPLQNNLPELWALLNFALPKIFNSVQSFDEWFNTPFANTGGQDRMELSEEETLLVIRRLHKVLRPFLLRRLKKDVEKDLPDKVERVIKCKMSALQAKMYEQMLKHKMLFLGEGAQGASQQGGLKGLNNQIMQLRKICNHPYVFEEVENLINPNKLSNDELWRAAGKFELLDRILPKFKRTGHRVLMFFQMTQIMDIMEDFLRFRGLQYLRLDGGTKSDERSDLLKLFNAEDSPYFAFLLSTRAGGLGLNLQSADTVIIYDTDWNPHQDLQAQDRAHRIGQTKEVRILRLITENSVEEHILEKAHAKLEIDGKVIQAGKFDNKSTNEEQEAFLRSLLEQEDQKRGQKDDDDDDLDDEELNEILARNDNEREQFRVADQERIVTDRYKGRRLLTLEELPEVYHQEIKIPNKEEEELAGNYGRGARERKTMHYDDGLTEEQWLDAVDDDHDTLEEAIARKRARKAKRNAKKFAIEGGGESPVPVVPDSPVATVPELAAAAAAAPPSSSSLPKEKKKRGRKPKVDEDLLPPRKKPKGRPPKVKETLSPQQRKELREQMEAAFEAVLSVRDQELDRNRVELFLELPSKKLYPDYYMLIKQPIACDLVEKRIKNNYYQSIDTFVADFVTMFNNARTYNEEGSIVYEDANALQKAMMDTLREVCPDQVARLENNVQNDDAPSRAAAEPGSESASVSASGSIPPQDDQPDLMDMNGNGEPVGSLGQVPSLPVDGNTGDDDFQPDNSLLSDF